MKKNIFIKSALILIFGAFLISISACNKAEEPSGNVPDPTVDPNPDPADPEPTPEPEVDKEKISLPYVSTFDATKGYHDSFYCDDYFKADSNLYNSRLALASLAVAMTGYPVNEKDRYSHTKELYNKIGFEKFYKNEFADQNNKKDALGVTMASKKLDGYTLISVNARGSSYGSEWASNFEAGSDGSYASGFNMASNIVLKTINDYINENNITGNIKIWAVGYSRSGAAINLAFGKIDEALAQNNKLLENVNYTKNDLFVYTFEAPAGRVGTIEDNIVLEKTENYNNIINLICLDDIVPMVMPKAWDFVRYGIDYYIPSKMTELDYNNYLTNLKDIIAQMYDKEKVGEYKLDTFTLTSGDKINYTFGKYIKMLLDDVFEEIGGLEAYVNDYEETLSQIIGLVNSSSTFRNALKEFVDQAKLKILAPAYARLTEPDIDKAVNDIFAAVETEYNAMLEKEAFNQIDNDKFTICAKRLMKILINVIKKEGGLSAVSTLVTWMSSAGYPHYPEIEYANLLAMEIGDVKYMPTDKYFIIEINNELGHTIELNGNKIAEYNDGLLTTNLVCEIIDNKYIYYLPATSNYREYKVLAKYYEIKECNGRYFNPKRLGSGGTC